MSGGAPGQGDGFWKLRRQLVHGRYDTMGGMTKLLEHAIEKVRALPEEDQDTLGAVMLAMAEDTPAVELDDETCRAIREGLEEARRGSVVSDDDINAIWKRHGI